MGSLKQSVLIVDDQKNWRDLLKEILEDHFDVASAESYPEALDVISKKVSPFHVVVTDMRLKDKEPGNEDGVKLIEYLYDQRDKTKTILLTGYPNVATAKKTLKLAAHDYLEKHPADGSEFNPDEFRKNVKKAADEAEKNRNHLVFVLMPFDKTYKEFYENAIKKVIEKMGLDCKRVDDFFGSRSIMSDVFKYIKDARFILADFSGRNANVFFEVGIAHALGKNVLLLAQDLEDIPPKLRTVRCIVYDRTLAGAARIASVLKNSVREAQLTNYPSFFENIRFESAPRQCLALIPGNDMGKQTYEDLVLQVLKENNCEGERAQEIFDPVSILNETWTHINTAGIVIADLSGRDADVFYLAGLAYGLEKNIIYLARDEADVPFDLKAGSHLIYSLDPFAEGLKAQQKLTRLVRSVLS